MKTLGKAQEDFAECVAMLINQALKLGFKVRIGEVERSQEQAKANAKSGKGIANSLHLKRLAVDIHLFKDGKYLTSTKSHEPLGVWWEGLGKKMGLPLCWGGRFGDGNHYSHEWQGVK